MESEQEPAEGVPSAGVMGDYSRMLRAIEVLSKYRDFPEADSKIGQIILCEEIIDLALHIMGHTQPWESEQKVWDADITVYEGRQVVRKIRGRYRLAEVSRLILGIRLEDPKRKLNFSIHYK